VQDVRIVGGPAWVGTERFDILAQMETGPTGQVRSDDVAMPSMIRHLLTDRFGLVVHAGTREMPVYALVKARPDGRLGPGLRLSTPARIVAWPLTVIVTWPFMDYWAFFDVYGRGLVFAMTSLRGRDRNLAVYPSCRRG